VLLQVASVEGALIADHHSLLQKDVLVGEADAAAVDQVDDAAAV
jgi:hypothetical protein